MNKLWNSIITSLARLLLGFCLVVGLSALTAGLVGTAHADSPIVITTCDEATLGNAFYNAPSGATIEFACSGSIQDLGELFPRPGTSLTLDASGQQVTIEGNGVEPVMTVSGGHLTLINLTIADGYGYDDFHGGGLNTIGADVTIRNSTFLHNAGREGGAIAMEGGSLSISNSTFANNSAPSAASASTAPVRRASPTARLWGIRGGLSRPKAT